MADLASSLLQNMMADGNSKNMDGMAAIGNVIGGLMQAQGGGNGGNVGDMLSGKICLSITINSVNSN